MKKLVFLGLGNAAAAVCRRAICYDTKYGTTRNRGRVDAIEQMGLIPISLEEGLTDAVRAELEEACRDAHVLASFPPSEQSDLDLSSAAAKANKIVYISSTAVYGGTSGIITEETPIDVSDPVAQSRLKAEETWRSAGAVVLRAPALYGPHYGLHVSLQAGKFKIPGDGRRFSSRIHLDDLANIVLSAFEKARTRSVYLVGDTNPATHIEVVTWLCDQLGISLPASIPLEDAHYTLRSNRRIKADRVLAELEIALQYPTYKDGFRQCLHC